MRSAPLGFMLAMVLLVASHRVFCQGTSVGQPSVQQISPEKAWEYLTLNLASTNEGVASNTLRVLEALFSSSNSVQWMSQEKALESLVSSNSQARSEAATVLDEQRTQLVKKLIAIVNSTNSANVKVDAVIVLGQYHASEAVPFLVQHLDWDGEVGLKMRIIGDSKERQELGAPVAYALCDIGLPAIPALLSKIAQTDDRKMTEKCVRICRAIEGPEVTQFRLQGLLERMPDQKQKGRIQSALEILKTVKPPTRVAPDGRIFY